MNSYKNKFGKNGVQFIKSLAEKKRIIVLPDARYINDRIIK